MAEYFPTWSEDSDKDKDETKRSNFDRVERKAPERVEQTDELIEHQRRVAFEAARRAAEQTTGFHERLTRLDEEEDEKAEKTEHTETQEAVELHEETGNDSIEIPRDTEIEPDTSVGPEQTGELVDAEPQMDLNTELRAIAREERDRLADPEPAVETYLSEIAEADTADPQAALEAAEEHTKELFDLKPIELQADQYLLDPDVQKIIENIDDRLIQVGGEIPETPDDFEHLAEAELGRMDQAPEVELAGSDHEPPALPEDTPETTVVHNGYHAPAVQPGVFPAGPPPLGPPNGGGGFGGGGGETGAAAAANALTPAHFLAERRRHRRQVLRVGLLAALAGWHFGKKSGRRKQAAEMQPQIDRLGKSNKDLRNDVADGQRRIRSLRRIQAEQAALIAEQANRPTVEAASELQESQPTAPIPIETTAPSPFNVSTPESTPSSGGPVSETITEPALQPEVMSSAEQQRPPLTSPELPMENPAQSVPEATGAPEVPLPLPEVLAVPTAKAEEANPTEHLEYREPATESLAAEEISVATMATPELMQMAQNVRLEGVNAAQMYQEGRLDDQALRRVVTEYVRGGTPEEALVHELGVVELRRAQSPEFLHENREKFSSNAGPSEIADAGTGGLSAAPAAPASTYTSDPSPEQLLPAYDDQDYPSDTPEPLLPAVALPDHHTDHSQVIIFSIGLGLVIAVALIFLFL